MCIDNIMSVEKVMKNLQHTQLVRLSQINIG